MLLQIMQRSRFCSGATISTSYPLSRYRAAHRGQIVLISISLLLIFQSNADSQSVVDLLHLLLIKCADLLNKPESVNGRKLLHQDDGSHVQPVLRRSGYMSRQSGLVQLARHWCDNYGGAVLIAPIVLNNQNRPETMLNRRLLFAITLRALFVELRQIDLSTQYLFHLVILLKTNM